jgi:TolB-like protein
MRSMSMFVRTAGAALSMCASAALTSALPSALHAQTDTRPVVVVFEFNNNSIGKDRLDYDGVQKGVQDLLITDLAGNSQYRLVDRSHLNQVLQEQNLVKGGSIDPATAVRVGKILGAQYAVTGGFMSDGKGGAVMTCYTIDMESTQDQNPQKIYGKTDDVLGLIEKMSTAINTQMKLTAKAPSRMGDASGVTHQSSGASSSAASAVQSGAPTDTVQLYARPLAVFPKTRLDVPTAKLYTRALDAMDDKDNAKAIDLFKQVLAKAPDFTPATQKLEQLGVKAAG